MDAFFVSVERVRDESLLGRPVVVGGRGMRGVVASASYEARPYGITAGMPLAQARRLCPEAAFLEGRFGHYQEVSRRLIDLLYSLTPDVEVSGIDEAYLDMTGFELLYGSPLATARRLKEQIRSELRVTASVGIASSKLVAKIASDFDKPDGLWLVPPGEEMSFLAPLPVARLPGVGPQTEKALDSLGVETIGQLARLPLPLLRRLFGRSGLTLHHHAQGLDDSSIEPPAEAKSISRSTTFERDTLDLAFLESILGYLTERVGAELRQGSRLAHCISLKLRYADFDTISRQQQLKQAADSDEAIFAVARGLLHRQLAQRRQLVRLVGVEVSHLARGRQLDLWQGRSWASLYPVLDKLRGKYGFTVLQRGRTFALTQVLAQEEGDYLLHTPALSR